MGARGSDMVQGQPWGWADGANAPPTLPSPSCTCSSVKLWKGVIAAGYGNGQIRLYEAATGVLRAQVHAHARWIYALDLAPLSGKVSPPRAVAPGMATEGAPVPAPARACAPSPQVSVH